MSIVAKVTRDDFYRFLVHCRKLVPTFTVRDGKSDSYLMNLVDGIVYPFNKVFMRNYVTTIFGSVYFPKGDIRRSPINAIEVTGHEFVHAYDMQRLTNPLFVFLYLSFISLFLVSLVTYGIVMKSLPVATPFAWAALYALSVRISFRTRKVMGFPLLVLSLLTMVGFAIWLDGWSSLWLLGSAVFLAPLPAPGRYWSEGRGYGASITFELALYGKTAVDRKVRYFTGPNYYWMWPFPSWVAAKLKSYETRARTGDVSDPAFLHVLEFIKDLKARYEGETNAA